MSEYEPPPSWNCDHQWVAVGPPIRFWASDGSTYYGTETEPPNIYVVHKCRCSRCGGVEYRPVVYLEDASQ